MNNSQNGVEGIKCSLWDINLTLFLVVFLTTLRMYAMNSFVLSISTNGYCGARVAILDVGSCGVASMHS